jgi:hypothetical protein
MQIKKELTMEEVILVNGDSEKKLWVEFGYKN